MPLYITGLLDGTIKSAPNIKTTNNLPCCLVMDADNALGLVVSRHAIDAAIDLAKKYGLGAVAVRNSSHFGGAGYYSDRAAQQGLIGFAFTNASPAIAPTGSKEALLGTNPDRRRVPAAQCRSDHSRHGDQRGGALAHPLHAGARGKRRCPTAGRSTRTASRPTIPPWR